MLVFQAEVLEDAMTAALIGSGDAGLDSRGVTSTAGDR